MATGFKTWRLSLEIVLVVWLTLLRPIVVESASLNAEYSGNHSSHVKGGIQVGGFEFVVVKMPFVITVVIIVATLSKLVFHYAHVVSSKIPESCLLIIIGVVLGAILQYSGAADLLPAFFSSHDFFHFLLPPIILEAAFSLHDRTFFNNIEGILLYAVVGTTLACFTVGYTLYGLAIAGAMGPISLTIVEALIFSALIVAVDPVAVLSIFEEVGVNDVLYFFVFGESLLNDGVTVVLYQLMQDFLFIETVDLRHIALGFTVFFVVAGGGFLVGILIGAVSAFVTKYTNNVRVVEPITVFGFAYIAFLVAEMFKLSGIISLIACGLVQMQYTFSNLTIESKTAIKYFSKVISTTNEIIIFLFLGLALVRPDHSFHVGFTLWTILLTLLFRFAITFSLTLILNACDPNRVHRITVQEQFIMSYGGLRGAVCFSLVAMLDENLVPHKPMFVTTTLAVVIFTVFVQGGTIKLLVTWLEIGLAPKKEPTFYQEMSLQIMDHLMAGVETVIGYPGKCHIKECLEYYDDKYLKQLLLRCPGQDDEDLLKLYGHQPLRDHLECLAASGARKIPTTPEGMNVRGEVEEEFIVADEDHSSSHLRRREKTEKVTTTRDLRALIRSKGATAKYDPDLTKEDVAGFQQQLAERKRRIQRLTKSKCSRSAGHDVGST